MKDRNNNASPGSRAGLNRLALGLVILCISVTGFSQDANEAGRLDVYQLAASLPSDKVSNFLKAELENHPLAPSAAARADGYSMTMPGEQKVAVSIRPAVSGKRGVDAAVRAVMNLPYLESPRFYENRGRILAYVRADELGLLVAHPSVGFVDHQPKAIFNRAGSVTPTTFLPNRIAELRNEIEDMQALPEYAGRAISTDGAGLKIGVISDGIAGSLWFRQEPAGEEIVADNCDPDAETSFTAFRSNPILPIAYQNVYDGDLPSRSVEAFILGAEDRDSTTTEVTCNPDDMPDTNSPGSYVEIREFNDDNGDEVPFYRVGESAVFFSTLNTVGIPASYPFAFSDTAVGSGFCIRDEEDENDPGTPDGDPFYASSLYCGLLNVDDDGNNINTLVTRVISNSSGLLANEGTAIIDIVRDYVPDAEFYFVNAFDALGYEIAARQLVAAGVDVIISDIAFVIPPFDGETNQIAAFINEVSAEGVLFITAAGNTAQNHNAGVITDATSNGLHDFVPGDETLRVRVQPGETIEVVLSWDERVTGNPNQNASAVDLNIFALDPTDPNIAAALASSQNPQFGQFGEVAQETFTFTNSSFPPLDQEVDIVITTPLNVPAGLPYQLFILPQNSPASGARLLEHKVTSGSFLSGPDARDALTIGSLDHRKFDEVSPLSARGPVANPNGAILKPDFVAFSDIENSTDNLQVFVSAANFPSGFSVGSSSGTSFLTILPANSPLTGTSGAMAEAAGQIAFYLSYLGDTFTVEPGQLVVDAVRATLEPGTADLEAIGADNISGRGRIDLYSLIKPDLLENNPLVNRYFWTDFNRVEDKQFYTPVENTNVGGDFGFNSASLGPTNENEPAALTYTTSDNTATYSFFQSPAITFNDGNSTLDDSKFYRVRVRVAERFSALPSPIIRVRAQARTQTFIHAHVINGDLASFDTSDSYETEERSGGVFTHYFQAPASANSMGMEINLDIINAYPEQDPTQTMLISEVEVLELDAL